ncbi:uncharacterized protein MAM_03683 [Metarhizium album ARSEF 1941]|uniref:DUF7905 domain-containing protein n=1 Tax=Metarhizium album (strain ARSEF 1941) TaxID=1081103 RepID=A0A0B2WY85_METAS|nr:uncharacterized protein MAM_03683 [Metarhizium album ARSEF 1941]KHN98559.1 hypothetical protein MAM_03683 [Metarhizium album ARSEF 1941]
MKTRQRSPRKPRGAAPADSHSEQEVTKVKRFAAASSVRSARFYIDDERRKTDTTTGAQYLDPPPEGENLLEAVLVIPKGHMLLQELSDTSLLDTIKTEKEVWIKQDKHNVLHIYSRTMWCLQEGFKAVNWALHDLSLARQNVSTRFLVQKPINAGADGLITVNLDCRPRVQQRQRTLTGTAEVAANVLKQLGSNFSSSMNTLRTIERPLRMHVAFGQVVIRSRKRGVGNTMPYSDFTQMALQYGTKGGAELDMRMPDFNQTSKLISHLLDPETSIYHRIECVTYNDSIRIKIKDQILTADVAYMQNGQPSLTNSRLVVSEEWPPLRWITVAPDRKYDWALQVDSNLQVQPIPEHVERLLRDLVICTEKPETCDPRDLDHRCLNINVKGPAKWTGKLGEVRTKLSALIPFRDTPFVIEISRNHIWRDVNTNEALHSWTEIQMLGRHWEDSLNYKKKHESKKDWGLHQCNIWAGSEMTAEDQFAGFICHVLEVLSALEGSDVDDITE